MYVHVHSFQTEEDLLRDLLIIYLLLRGEFISNSKIEEDVSLVECTYLVFTYMPGELL